MKWKRDHILSIEDFDREDLERILKQTDRIWDYAVDPERNYSGYLDGYKMITLFYEPSTRTRGSFEAAIKFLGGKVQNVHIQNSSVQKGESLQDTVRTVQGWLKYKDKYKGVIVLRSPEPGSAHEASIVSKVPIINGGDGPRQHPTQTILDLYTIEKNFGKIDGLKIALIGDLKYGRTPPSLSTALSSIYKVKELILISPEGLEMKSDMVGELKRHVKVTETDELNLKDVDVAYVTRIQKERFPSKEDYEKIKGAYIIDKKIANSMPENSIIMHPLPRVDEIHPKVDENPRSKYFEQAENGVKVRMTLIRDLLKSESKS